MSDFEWIEEKLGKMIPLPSLGMVTSIRVKPGTSQEDAIEALKKASAIKAAQRQLEYADEIQKLSLILFFIWQAARYQSAGDQDKKTQEIDLLLHGFLHRLEKRWKVYGPYYVVVLKEEENFSFFLNLDDPDRDFRIKPFKNPLRRGDFEYDLFIDKQYVRVADSLGLGDVFGEHPSPYGMDELWWTGIVGAYTLVGDRHARGHIGKRKKIFKILRDIDDEMVGQWPEWGPGTLKNILLELKKHGENEYKNLIKSAGKHSTLVEDSYHEWQTGETDPSKWHIRKPKKRKPGDPPKLKKWRCSVCNTGLTLLDSGPVIRRQRRNAEDAKNPKCPTCGCRTEVPYVPNGKPFQEFEKKPKVVKDNTGGLRLPMIQGRDGEWYATSSCKHCERTFGKVLIPTPPVSDNKGNNPVMAWCPMCEDYTRTVVERGKGKKASIDLDAVDESIYVEGMTHLSCEEPGTVIEDKKSENWDRGYIDMDLLAEWEREGSKKEKIETRDDASSWTEAIVTGLHTEVDEDTLSTEGDEDDRPGMWFKPVPASIIGEDDSLGYYLFDKSIVDFLTMIKKLPEFRIDKKRNIRRLGLFYGFYEMKKRPDTSLNMSRSTISEHKQLLRDNLVAPTPEVEMWFQPLPNPEHPISHSGTYPPHWTRWSWNIQPALFERHFDYRLPRDPDPCIVPYVIYDRCDCVRTSKGLLYLCDHRYLNKRVFWPREGKYVQLWEVFIRGEKRRIISEAESRRIGGPCNECGKPTLEEHYRANCLECCLNGVESPYEGSLSIHIRPRTRRPRITEHGDVWGTGWSKIYLGLSKEEAITHYEP